MEITVIQAALIAILGYMGTLLTPWLLGCIGGWYTLGRPLVSGMFIGLILGDVQTGVIVGAAVQAVFIAMVTPGGSMPTDLNSAAFIGVGLGIVTVKTGATVEAAVAVATAVGAVGVILHNMLCVTNTIFNQGCIRAIDSGNVNSFLRNHWVWPQIALFISRAIPTFMILYYGQGIANEFISTFPPESYLMRVLAVLGGILPAIGVAILIKNVVKKGIDLLPVVLGFTFVAALGLNMISLAIIAAYFAYTAFKSNGNTVVENKLVDDDDLGEVL